MQSANLPNRDDRAGFHGLDGTRLWRVLLQCQMRATPMIVSHERLKVLVQASFIEHNHMIEALTTYGADHAFNVGALPWRARRRQHLFDSHGLDLFNEFAAEDPVAIPQQILWRLPHGNASRS